MDAQWIVGRQQAGLDQRAQQGDGALDIGLVALPQVAGKGVGVTPWRRDPILAYVPADWQPPARVTPAWLGQRALILNDSSTQLSRVIGNGSPRPGCTPNRGSS
ncbi:hypothetical protein GCM10011247_06700 [Pseudomonas plecoglossicida]|nr:hypothetical protein GCM10011247_06700 [Pseudomonas plecoglossicida]